MADRDLTDSSEVLINEPLLAEELIVHPQPHTENIQKTSTLATFFIFLKSYLGSGIMGMASAYVSGGAIVTTIMIFGVAVLSCFCFSMLFRVRDDIIKRQNIPIYELHFERVIEEILGLWGKRATIAAIIFTQAGFATAYVIFISNNLEKLYPVLSFREYAAVLIVPLILLCWVRQLKWLNPFAMAGILAVGLAVGTVTYYCVLTIQETGVDMEFILRMDWSTFPIAFGVVIYLFEGIGLVLPLEQKMEDPSKFIYVMWAVHLFVAVAVSSFGLLGYSAFYLCTKGPIILNLPNTGILVSVTIWTLNVCLLFTYPIQMVPVFQIIEDAFLPSASTEDSQKRNWWAKLEPYTRFLVKSMSLRAIVVLVSVGCAVSIPYFDLFLSLVGGLGSAQLMFILPPIAYLVCFWKDSHPIIKMACFVLLAFGILTMVVTTVFTVIGIVHEFQHLNNTLCNVTNATTQLY